MMLTGTDIATSKCTDCVCVVSNLSVPMSIFDVTGSSNFHKVLKNSVVCFKSLEPRLASIEPIWEWFHHISNYHG